MKAYLQWVIKQSRKHYGDRFRATEAEPDVAFKMVVEEGDFILCLINTELFEVSEPGNKRRAEEVFNYVSKNKFSDINPILVREIKDNKIITMDGKTRLWVSKRLGRQI